MPTAHYTARARQDRELTTLRTQAQELADEAGETVFLVLCPPAALEYERNLPYFVVASEATAWCREHAAQTFPPISSLGKEQ